MTNYLYDSTCPYCKTELTQGDYEKDDAGLPYTQYYCKSCGHKAADYGDTSAHEWAEDNKKYKFRENE